MALNKQNLPVSFAASLDLKTDPLQLSPMSMLRLVNGVYTKDKRLQKRNGYAQLTSLPTGANVTTLATFNENLTAIGTATYAYASGSSQWVNHGRFQPVQLSVLSLARTAYSLSACDAAVSGTGLVCSVFSDNGTYKYLISDSATSQALTSMTSLPSTATAARVFVVGNFFVITFLISVAGTPNLQYVAVPLTNVTAPRAAVAISTNVASATTAGYDGYVVNNALYLAWAGGDGGGAVRVTYLNSALSQASTVVFTGHNPVQVSVTSQGTRVWVSYYITAGTDLYTLCLSLNLATVLNQTLVTGTTALSHITSVASGTTLTIFSDVTNDYSYVSVHSNYITSTTVTEAGVVGTPGVVVRSVALGSKAFIVGDHTYFLGIYGGALQPTYFLCDSLGNVVAKLAYSNAPGYISSQVLPSAIPDESQVHIGYLLAVQLTPVNRLQGAANVSGIYTQAGVNLATFDLTSTALITAEIGNNLHIAGGFLWMYDGTQAVEHGFHVWPDQLKAAPATSGGSMADATYYYQATYEWTDAQGNIHRSAPSVPLVAVVSGGGGSGSVVLNIPTLRLTAKTNVRICIYRWSSLQQIYYLITSVTSPTLNNKAVDSIAYTDTQANASIAGNLILYTTGGVVENIAAPACSALALYKNRLMVLSSEDRNSVWYSKQVIESVPVETSDVFTIFFGPTIGAQGSTGPCGILASMDDKFIAGKSNAFYYITGNGPDNTGANNDFSEPVYVSSTVGTSRQLSIALIPQGLMFQSDKGIWLLGRDLSTKYIGDRVEDYNSDTVLNATVIPGTNQVRFCMDNGQALMYDYYYDRWATFSNIPSISATLFEDLHTYVTDDGVVYQESPDSYLDGPNPVLLGFTTAWFNLAGLQGFERAYMLYLLSSYLTPHKLNVRVAYDYNPSPSQSMLITPDNASPIYGDGAAYGQDSPYGGPGSKEQYRIFLSQQKCQAFQLIVDEVYDPSLGLPAGAGLTLSGLNIVAGIKKGYVPLPASKSVG